MANKTLSQKKQNVTMLLIGSVGFFGILSTTISKTPVLSLFINALGGDVSVIGLISAISPLAGIMFSFPVGFMSDRIGKKKMLIVSSSVFLTAPVLYLLVNDAMLLIPIRFFHGIATAILGPIASAIICDAYPDNKGEKLGIYSSATLIGRTIAPLIGGSIITSFVFMNGIWNYKMVYVFALIVAVPVFVFSLLVKENTYNATVIKKIRIGDFFKAIRDFLTEKKLLGTSLVELATYFTFGAFETFLQIYLKSNNYSEFLIGTVFSIQIFSIALTKPLFGKMSDNVDRRLQIIIGMLILAVSIAIIPVFQNPILIVAISIVFGLGMSLSTVATSTYVADIAAKEKLGASMGALSSIMDIGHSSGPLVVGIIISIVSQKILINHFSIGSVDIKYFVGFAACSFVCILSTVVFYVFNFGKK